MLALSFGLPAYALVKVLLPAFYSRQDTRTPVRAGVVALVANMLFNVLFIALLFELWAPPALKQGSWIDGIAQVPGLHVGLAIASSLSSYVNFAAALALAEAGWRLPARAGLGAALAAAGGWPVRRWWRCCWPGAGCGRTGAAWR